MTKAQIDNVMNAAAHGDVGAMAALLARDARLANASGPHPIWSGRPQPLHVAAERNHLDIVRALLAAGADVDGADADYDGWSPLMLAVHGGRLGIHAPRPEIAALLIDHGATVDLFAAARMGALDRVAAALAARPDSVNQRGPADATALHFARDATIAHALLKAGADPNAVCGWQTTPIERASFLGATGQTVAAVLIQHGAQASAGTLACLGDLDRLIARLKERPDELSAPSKVGASIVGTPLHGAAQHGHVEVVRYLLDLGADVNSRANAGQTPLHLGQRNLQLVKLLVNAGADTRATDSEHHTTPLAWARFFYEHLEPDSTVLPQIIAFLESKPH